MPAGNDDTAAVYSSRLGPIPKSPFMRIITLSHEHCSFNLRGKLTTIIKARIVLMSRNMSFFILYYLYSKVFTIIQRV